MSSAIEELVRQLRGSEAETLNVPHPCRIKNVRVTPMTNWVTSKLRSNEVMADGRVIERDFEKNADGDWVTHVHGQICEIANIDDYNEPIGDPQFVVQHKYVHPERKSNDVSTSMISPQSVRELKLRFPDAFEQFERRMASERKDLPIAFMDNVPPEVLTVIRVMGAKTVRDFAEFGEAELKELVRLLLDHKLAARVNFVPDYYNRAREKSGLPLVGEVKVEDTPEDTLKRGPGRPKKQAA